ncbi:alpha carbonic anhydrase [Echria macrotheca]|uniref:Carbonic anhydrase n=1 Tax=Echria macrotheca TaxID=438768 RepID=A0AAJ0F7H1_9PEZI|nr:alpha carbonic anhydrase [Echria macrotheca]
MARKVLLLILSLTGTCLAHEHHGTTLFPRADDIPPPAFGYHGINGPLNWYGLDQEKNELCAKGTHQSPIDLSSSTCGRPNEVWLNIPPAPHGAEFLNLGTTVEVITNGTLYNKGKMSNLAQFHFHSPSEHSIDGKYFPMEVHFVFQADDGSLSVTGFPINLGNTTDPLLKAVADSLSEIPSHGNTTTTGPLSFETVERHFAGSGIFQYSGSLTTPPCSEGVSWTVSCAPLSADAEVFNAFHNVLKFNARYTQNQPGQINLLQNIANELN